MNPEDPQPYLTSQVASEPAESDHPRRRAVPCERCRRLRHKCTWTSATDPDVCDVCALRGEACSGPVRHMGRRPSCAACTASKLKCMSDPGSAACVRCTRRGDKCIRPREAEGLGNPKPAPIPTVQSNTYAVQISPSSPTWRIAQTQLSFSLAWHCIQMCCNHDFIGWAVGDRHQYMEMFQGRNPSKPAPNTPDYEALLTSVVIFSGAELSTHSALVGSTLPRNYVQDETKFGLDSAELVMSPQRMTALHILSNDLMDKGLRFAQNRDLSLKTGLDRLNLVRLVLGKSTGGSVSWQWRVCSVATADALALLPLCVERKEKFGMMQLVRNIAMKGLIVAVTYSLPLPLNATDMHTVFGLDPHGLSPSYHEPTVDELESALFGVDGTHLAFFQWLYITISTPIYDVLAFLYWQHRFTQDRPARIQSTWTTLTNFYSFSKESVTWALENTHRPAFHPRATMFIRMLLAYEANFIKLELLIYHRLPMTSPLREESRRRIEVAMRRLSDAVAIVEGLPIRPARRLEILMHQIFLLLDFDGQDLVLILGLLTMDQLRALQEGVNICMIALNARSVPQMLAIADLLKEFLSVTSRSQANLLQNAPSTAGPPTAFSNPEVASELVTSALLDIGDEANLAIASTMISNVLQEANVAGEMVSSILSQLHDQAVFHELEMTRLGGRINSLRPPKLEGAVTALLIMIP